MMNTAFRRETVNAVYLALQATKLNDLLKLVNEIPIQGLSVTMPFKQEIMAHLENTDPLSAKIGACNTVLRAQDGKLYGFNTDVAGITGPLEKRMSLRGAKALVLGAGGAARAAVFGLRDKGADVFILNRTAETAQKLARQSGSKTIKKDALPKTAFDVIINTTPVGMAGIKANPILEAKDLNTKLVFDLVYNPLETPLLRLARQQNIPIITGIEMFVQQGARQFEIWTGKPAPEEEMLRVVIHALRQAAETAAAEAPPAPAAKSNHSTTTNGKAAAPKAEKAPAKKAKKAS
jgi:3-dehydroquinate dehydratase/shikimate dehydrogenase